MYHEASFDGKLDFTTPAEKYGREY